MLGLGLGGLLVTPALFAQTEKLPVPAPTPLTRTEITDSTQHTAGVVVTIAGATAMPVGGVLAVLKLLSARAARDACSDGDETCSESDDQASQEDRADVYDVLSASFMFGGLALMATGITLMTTATDEVAVQGDVALAPVAYPSGAGLGALVRW